MVALDGDNGEFFVVGGDRNGGIEKRAFMHKNNQWNEKTPMTTARVGKKT